MSITVRPLPYVREALESQLARRALIQRTPLESSELEDVVRSSACWVRFHPATRLRAIHSHAVALSAVVRKT